MGEQPFRVFTAGAPQLDDLLNSQVTPRCDLFKKLGLNGVRPLMIVVQHPVTEEFDKAEAQMCETLSAVKEFEAEVVIILNNSDAGSNEIARAIQSARTPAMRVFPNLPRSDYVGLMAAADVLVGNSSSGILEAPSFGLPAVNIGCRQFGRLQARNVINVPQHKCDAIKQAIARALSPKFKLSLKDRVNPYGDGQSAKRIVDIIARTERTENLVVKKLTY
jgi:UDP-hydrolysing UDP-N-acetyl-D-glucosamine 2-epimerase